MSLHFVRDGITFSIPILELSNEISTSSVKKFGYRQSPKATCARVNECTPLLRTDRVRSSTLRDGDLPVLTGGIFDVFSERSTYHAREDFFPVERFDYFREWDAREATHPVVGGTTDIICRGGRVKESVSRRILRRATKTGPASGGGGGGKEKKRRVPEN